MAKKKKKKDPSIISKTKKGVYGEGHRMRGTKQKFKRSYPGEDPKAVEYPPEVPDAEDEMPEPKDEAAKHKFPPPKKHPTFRRVWMDFIDNISKRENFKSGHLNSLEILCDLHVEYDELRAFIRKKGRSYQSYGRAGMIWKFYPEVAQLNNVQAQIKEYMKMLGLLLKKDHSTQDEKGEKGEWD